jgi:hypothetical protein
VMINVFERLNQLNEDRDCGRDHDGVRDKDKDKEKIRIEILGTSRRKRKLYDLYFIGKIKHLLFEN